VLAMNKPPLTSRPFLTMKFLVIPAIEVHSPLDEFFTIYQTVLIINASA
jgi:hypothetical protein